MGRTKRKAKKRKPYLLILVLVVLIAATLWVMKPHLEEKMYPLEYTDQIRLNATAYDLDPYFVAAVIKTESGFDPQAESGAGARGLMQLMPETGSWIAGKLDMGTYTDDLLYDPTTNIKLGCWYLRFLEDRFHDDRNLVSAAYNAGHNRVSQWLEDESISPEGVLTNIPFEETSKYVDKVLKAEEKYRALYPGAFDSPSAT